MALLATAPPACNTGAQNTQRLPSVSSSIDWIGFTFHEITDVQQVLDMFWLDWYELPKGHHGYKGAFSAAGVTVYYDGRPDMGIHVEASGQGCRSLEQCQAVTSWCLFLDWLSSRKAKITRLDVAVDDTVGILSMQRLYDQVIQGTVVSKFKTARPYVVHDLSQPNDVLQAPSTLYFGSSKSDCMIRAYDKATEQKVGGPWIRVEMQLRDERAVSMARQIMLHDVGVVSEVIYHYLDFKVPSADVNRSRWQTVSWWSQFLDAARKTRLFVRPTVLHIQKTYEWICKQVSPSIACVLTAVHGDLDVICAIAEIGRAKLRDRHQTMLRNVPLGWEPSLQNV